MQAGFGGEGANTSNRFNATWWMSIHNNLSFIVTYVKLTLAHTDLISAKQANRGVSESLQFVLKGS